MSDTSDPALSRPGPSVARPRKLVVAGLAADREGRVLLTQRRPGGDLGGMWEFPGGKIEPGEAPEEALRRELREEIDVEVTVGRVWDVISYAYPRFDLLMLLYPCRLGEGVVPRAVDVAAVAWVRIEDLDQYSILPADRPLIERLQREGLPAFFP